MTQKEKDPQKDKSVKPITKKDKSFVIDHIAFIRTKTRLPDSYEKFIWNFINDLPKSYDRIDIVAGTYRTNSIKNAELETIQDDDYNIPQAWIQKSQKFVNFVVSFVKMSLFCILVILTIKTNFDFISVL